MIIIEDEQPVKKRRYCECGEILTNLIKIISNDCTFYRYDSIVESKKITASVCINIKCKRFTNIKSLLTWKKA